MTQPSSRQVVNFPRQTRGMNFYAVDRNLERFLERSAPDVLRQDGTTLRDLGAFAGSRLDRQAELSDQHFPPALRDVPDDLAAPQKRRNEVRLNSEYEDCQQELYRRGLVAKCFDGPYPQSHILPFVAQYLVSQADISTGCPFAMTHPVAHVLQTIAPAAVREQFLPEITRTDGNTAVCGTWATEKHSGSDVGGSVTKAVKGEDGGIRLHGHNWFTSAFGFKKFLAIKTARPDGAPSGSKGLGLYLVPSHVDDDWAVGNNFSITHLKRKLGTKGLPTVEVELEGAQAYEIAPAGQGIKAMMTALGCSRVHNSMAAAGAMHRAFLESMCWVQHRETFGDKLVIRPMVQKRILDIATTWMAGSALAFEAAVSFDEAASGPGKAAWMRIATAIAKFKTAEQAVWCAQKALELVGGNGYTEDYPTARQFRDAMVLTVWEGPEQIQALELMRMIAGKERGDLAFLERLAAIADGLPPAMKKDKARLEKLGQTLEKSLAKLSAQPEKVELVADEFLHKMADVLSYALLCEEASWELGRHNDRSKLLVARHYYDRSFTRSSSPSFEQGALHRQFNAIVTGMPVAANGNRPGQKSSDPKGPR